MAITVTKQILSLGGGMAAVLNQVTGDGTLKTWDTGLRKVMFYTGTAEDDEHVLASGWYLNYSDNGSTAKDGAVCFNTTAPDSGEVWYCFGIGKL
jgi:hypothetical protein